MFLKFNQNNKQPQNYQFIERIIVKQITLKRFNHE